MSATTVLNEARKCLGITGEPNRITRWYAQRNGNAFLTAAWCDMGVTYWAHHGGEYRAMCPKGDRAYTVWHAQDGRDLGKWYPGTAENMRHARPGAIIFFDWGGTNSIPYIDHVGLVERVLGDGRVQTIEANTSNGVFRRVRSSNVVAGFWNPAFSSSPATPKPPIENWTEKVVKTLPDLKKGATGKYVKKAQGLLLAAGRKLPKYGIDGDFGDETKNAVTAFQKATKITVDGEVGKETWTKLLT